MQRMRRKIILNIGELQHQSEEVHGRLASYTEEIALGCWRRRPCITHTDTLYLCVAAAAALLSQLNISNLANAKEAKRCNRNESDGKKNTEWRTNNNLFAVHVECELVRFFKLFLLMESIQFDTAFLEEEGNFDQFESQTQCGHRFERKILTCNLQFIDL